MPDVRGMFDRKYIGAWDLVDRAGKPYDVTARIARVVREELMNEKKKTSNKPIVYFEKAARGFALNKTNMKIIMGMYGPNTDDWIGKLITMFPTKAQFGSETVDAIRVRPRIPQGRETPPAPTPPVDDEMRAKQLAAANAASPPPVREPGDDHDES